MQHILIADDHAMFREGLKLLLKSDPRFKVVGEAADGLEALSLIERLRPGIAVLDVALPKMNGIDVLRGVISRGIPSRCIMLTMHEEPEIALSAMEAGAVGYILKGHTFDELKEAVDAVLGGGRFVSPRIAPALQGLAARKDRRDTTLTGRELEILSLIAQGKANKEIADLLAISIRTVEAHRAKIMRKIGVRSHAGLIHYAMQFRMPLMP